MDHNTRYIASIVRQLLDGTIGGVWKRRSSTHGTLFRNPCAVWYGSHFLGWYGIIGYACWSTKAYKCPDSCPYQLQDIWLVPNSLVTTDCTPSSGTAPGTLRASGGSCGGERSRTPVPGSHARCALWFARQTSPGVVGGSYKRGAQPAQSPRARARQPPPPPTTPALGLIQRNAPAIVSTH